MAKELTGRYMIRYVPGKEDNLLKYLEHSGIDFIPYPKRNFVALNLAPSQLGEISKLEGVVSLIPDFQNSPESKACGYKISYSSEKERAALLKYLSGMGIEHDGFSTKLKFMLAKLSSEQAGILGDIEGLKLTKENPIDLESSSQ